MTTLEKLFRQCANNLAHDEVLVRWFESMYVENKREKDQLSFLRSISLTLRETDEMRGYVDSGLVVVTEMSIEGYPSYALLPAGILEVLRTRSLENEYSKSIDYLVSSLASKASAISGYDGVASIKFEEVILFLMFLIFHEEHEENYVFDVGSLSIVERKSRFDYFFSSFLPSICDYFLDDIVLNALKKYQSGLKKKSKWSNLKDIWGLLDDLTKSNFLIAPGGAQYLFAKTRNNTIPVFGKRVLKKFLKDDIKDWYALCDKIRDARFELEFKRILHSSDSECVNHLLED